MLPDYSTFSISTNRRAEANPAKMHITGSDGIRVDGYCLKGSIPIPMLVFSVQSCIVYFDIMKKAR